MDGRGRIAACSVFLVPLVIILLIISIVQSGQANVSVNEDRGDWLIWALRVEPKTLNPISAEADIYTTWITMPYIFEPLMTYDYDTMQLKPYIAERCDVSGDGLEITFKLRNDVHFSDSVPLTADDVIFTYETIVNPKVDAANLANRYDNVSRVTKVSDFEVKFLLKKPHFRAAEDLSFARTTGVLPKHVYQFRDGEEFNRHISDPIGTGPYIFEKWDTGSCVILRRNENYWADKLYLSKIVYRFISNPVAAVQALRSHQVDIIIPEPEQFADLAGDTQFTKDFYCLSYWTPSTPFYYIGWNLDTPFFSDRRVRMALAGIINREQMVTHLLEGYGRVITGPFYIFGPENDPNIKPVPYDPGKSGQLLDQAGWRDTDGDGRRDKNGVPFRFELMYANSYRLYERLAKVLKDEAAKVGIEIIPRPCEWSILQARLRQRKFHAYVAGWSGDVLQDPYPLFHSSQTGYNGSNFAGFNSPDADAIIEQAARTIDNGERHQLYLRLHKILYEQQPYTFLFTRPTLRFIDRRFKNVVVHNLGLDYLQWYVPMNEQRYK